MATIYRPTYRHEGKVKKVKKWYIRYRDHSGKLKKVPGFTDKTATQRLAARLELEADMIRNGMQAAPVREQDGIAADIAAFRKSLENREVSADQVELVVYRCNQIVDGCKVVRAADLAAAAVEEKLAELRKGGLSVQTSNHYLRAIRQFSRWLYRHKRLREDPLLLLDTLNVAVDRRHDRRALSDDEVSKLLTHTKTAAVILAFTGMERFMLYVVALSTGLRASELASLTPESLKLLDEPPTVTVKAGYSKRRRTDVLPLPAEILEELRSWLLGKPAGERLWPGNWAENRYGGKILRQDIEAAGLVYKDADGLFADFHALRHTYITNLARHGVPLTTAQKLARHSTPVLTAARYTHIDLNDQSKEVQKLPALLGRSLGRTMGTNGQKAAPDGSENEEPGADSKPGKKQKTPKKSGISPVKRAEGGGFEPPLPLRAGRFSRPVQSAALPPLRSLIFQDILSFDVPVAAVADPRA